MATGRTARPQATRYGHRPHGMATGHTEYGHRPHGMVVTAHQYQLWVDQGNVWWRYTLRQIRSRRQIRVASRSFPTTRKWSFHHRNSADIFHPNVKMSGFSENALILVNLIRKFGYRISCSDHAIFRITRSLLYIRKRFAAKSCKRFEISTTDDAYWQP